MSRYDSAIIQHGIATDLPWVYWRGRLVIEVERSGLHAAILIFAHFNALPARAHLNSEVPRRRLNQAGLLRQAARATRKEEFTQHFQRVRMRKEESSNIK